MARVAINGFGRIGRNVFRAYIEAAPKEWEIVAINDPFQNLEQSAHLLQFDSVLGEFKHNISVDGEFLVVDGKKVKFTAEKDPANCPWAKLEIDMVLECSGAFTDAEKAKAHITAGAKKVLISAPAKNEDITIVLGVNDKNYDAEKHNIISNASCTTNCLAPVAKALDDAFGIEHGLMTTIHSYTLDQKLLDGAHSDLRRARAAALSMIPSTTGAAKAIGLVMPHLKGKLNGFAMRVPTPNVSVVDLVVTLKKDVTAESVNKAIKDAAESGLKGYLQYSEKPLVSIDFCGNKVSSIVDADLTMIVGERMVKVLAWYDNEWGYSNRLVELATLVAKKLPVAAK
ncbi:MAG: type I glyceraldehyde-3-phosphate dehydrogenase [Candidatus Obscuribacter sp.]|jgi:glyceraldehyde 3-phosphate dehydrogenase|nr:type I glyceraldehyde-3-phosphate dehydrogenase [Candidatus Obscuribacter sp.]MBK7837060.1 type I glyceraldehyde-3-phosphate dehydrogenase [Candidatus Obscuribacter sp.]MBK9205096.1 type I glyceraldehyde-3-phosphate dehydrogenase [Candidatus Obscuribacter sp.]MBK9620352.1 type I glyceraldehyde-3-phosphate dehydrogenase [Candidatus Obscuribacter sp.]MBK9773446.1 type I glyceraldehyde-3-phosphate dehydrogenase [Candidatus Obscuribacter sp.]